MVITLKKNIVPAFTRDVASSLAFVKRIESDFGIRSRTLGRLELQMGFEAIIRYNDLESLRKVQENLKACSGYPMSIHAPLNLDAPETVDLCTDQGYAVIERLVEFADRTNIPLIVMHPNSIRAPGYFAERGFSEQEQEEKIAELEQRTKRLNQLSKVKVALENKPQPATSVDFESVLYSPVFTNYNQLLDLSERGVPIVFDTAHYAITRATIHSVLATLSQKKDVKLEELLRGFHGLFPKQCFQQPTIPEALDALGNSVQELHLNDSAPYKLVEGRTLYWEGLVPGIGCLVNSKDVIGFLKKQKNVPVVFEVYENDYSLNPNAYSSIKEFLQELDGHK